jgi:hypothetical protein
MGDKFVTVEERKQKCVEEINDVFARHGFQLDIRMMAKVGSSMMNVLPSLVNDGIVLDIDLKEMTQQSTEGVPSEDVSIIGEIKED